MSNNNVIPNNIVTLIGKTELTLDNVVIDRTQWKTVGEIMLNIRDGKPLDIDYLSKIFKKTIVTTDEFEKMKREDKLISDDIVYFRDKCKEHGISKDFSKFKKIKADIDALKKDITFIEKYNKKKAIGAKLYHKLLAEGVILNRNMTHLNEIYGDVTFLDDDIKELTDDIYRNITNACRDGDYDTLVKLYNNAKSLPYIKGDLLDDIEKWYNKICSDKGINKTIEQASKECVDNNSTSQDNSSTQQDNNSISQDNNSTSQINNPNLSNNSRIDTINEELVDALESVGSLENTISNKSEDEVTISDLMSSKQTDTKYPITYDEMYNALFNAMKSVEDFNTISMESLYEFYYILYDCALKLNANEYKSYDISKENISNSKELISFINGLLKKLETNKFAFDNSEFVSKVPISNIIKIIRDKNNQEINSNQENLKFESNNQVINPNQENIKKSISYWNLDYYSKLYNKFEEYAKSGKYTEESIRKELIKYYYYMCYFVKIGNIEDVRFDIFNCSIDEFFKFLDILPVKYIYVTLAEYIDNLNIEIAKDNCDILNVDNLELIENGIDKKYVYKTSDDIEYLRLIQQVNNNERLYEKLRESVFAKYYNNNLMGNSTDNSIDNSMGDSTQQG